VAGCTQTEEISMSNKKLRFSFNKIIEAAGKLKCEDLHHKKAHLHNHDEMCPAEYELQKHAFILRKYMKDNSI
jgi:hypothetical protein